MAANRPRSEKLLVPHLFYDALSVEIPGNPSNTIRTLGQLAAAAHRVGNSLYLAEPRYTRSSLDLVWIPGATAHASHVQIMPGVDELVSFSLTYGTHDNQRAFFSYFRTITGVEALSITAPDRFRKGPIPLGFGEALNTAQQEVSSAAQGFFAIIPPPDEPTQM